MGDKTGIEWTDATWNPVVGCRRVSEGCRNCYAETVACGNVRRLRGVVEKSGSAKAAATLNAYEQAVKMDGDGEPRPLWSGTAVMRPEMLDQPLRWKNPRRIFVNSMSDLFHEDVSNEFIAAVFGVMAAAPQHTFQVLTKRPARMLEFFVWLRGLTDGSTASEPSECQLDQLLTAMSLSHEIGHVIGHVTAESDIEVFDDLIRFVDWWLDEWPLPNVHLGVSVEDQATFDERVPMLLQCPAAVRWVSMEPLLGPVDGFVWEDGAETCCSGRECGCHGLPIEPPMLWHLDWVIVGGAEHPVHPQWVRDIRDQCEEAGVLFRFNQWGEWYPAGGTGFPPFTDDVDPSTPYTWVDERTGETWSSGCEPSACMLRVGKKRAGRMLDGVAHDGVPT